MILLYDALGERQQSAVGIETPGMARVAHHADAPGHELGTPNRVPADRGGQSGKPWCGPSPAAVVRCRRRHSWDEEVAVLLDEAAASRL